MEHKKKIRIHVVEDDGPAREAMRDLLIASGYLVDTSENGRVAVDAISEHPPDLVVTDLDMPELGGIGLIEELKERDFRLPVIVLTAHTDLSTAVRAMRAGADDYLTKPLDFEALELAVERALESRALRSEVENFRRHHREKGAEGLSGLVGTSPAMQRVYRVARQVAPSRATVLVTGESGTGKGELARAIHNLSPRKSHPFVSVHCAALAETLLESELFGHEKGAFTGADKRRAGRFEQANGGTLFLDEVGEISLPTQVKLLTVLQERTFQRVGGNETIRVDVRIVAATNRNLVDDVKSGRFREDLFYRLNVIHIDLPPLRLRAGDVVVLAEYFLEKYMTENHKPLRGLTDRAKAKIRTHLWPGNVRALENAIERAVVLSEGDWVDADDLPFEQSQTPVLEGLHIPGSTMAEVEKYVLLKTLEAVDGSTARAAEMLDIGVRTVQYRLNEYGIGRSKTPTPPKG